MTSYFRETERYLYRERVVNFVFLVVLEFDSYRVIEKAVFTQVSLFIYAFDDKRIVFHVTKIPNASINLNNN